MNGRRFGITTILYDVCCIVTGVRPSNSKRFHGIHPPLQLGLSGC